MINLRFDCNSFITAASSNHGHRYTSLGKISAGLVAIAGFGSNNEVELYESGNWYNQPRFPEEDYFYYYSVATYEDLLYVFGELNFYFDRHFITQFFISGGRNRDGKLVHIGRMTDLGLEWTKGPELLIARERHRSILIENRIYHIGGSGNL